MTRITGSFGSIRVRASVLALFFYRVQFQKDLTDKVREFITACDELANNTDVYVLQNNLNFIESELPRILWALNKAQDYAEERQTKAYAHWFKSYGGVSAVEVMSPLLTELMDGFYSDVVVKANGSTQASGESNDFAVITSCKRMGYSFAEMNELTMRSLAEISNIYIGAQAECRTATQSDINNFF